MYLNILDEKRNELLNQINHLSFVKDFSMGGGTALSLPQSYVDYNWQDIKKYFCSMQKNMFNII